MTSQPHEVSVLCACEDVEDCEMERYISDVRMAYAEIERLTAEMWARTKQIVQAA